MTTAGIWKSLSVMMVLALVVTMAGAVGMPTRVEALFPTVIINEFVSNASPYNEWVELFNTTSNDINLTGYNLHMDIDNSTRPVVTGCSAIIPANGILVVEIAPPGWLLDNPPIPCTISLLNASNNGIYSVTYGTGTALQAPGAGKSAARFDPDTWLTNQTPSKGWFNDCGQPNKAPCLNTIDAQLAAQGITSNIGELDNPSNTPTGDAGLYFEKTGMGKIVINNCLNLSDQNTVNALQTLGEKMEMAAASLSFDSATATAMEILGAKLYMYGLTFPSMPDLIVLTDAGAVIPPGSGNYPTITNQTYTGGTFSFSTNHFTKFKAVERPVSSQAPPTVGGADDSSYGERSSTTLRSAAMKVRYLKVTPQQAYTNQPVVVTTNVINDGGDGSYNVMLRINDRVEETKTVSVSGGAAKQVQFTVTKSQPGTYTVQVGNEKSIFTVVAGDKVSESAPMNEGMLVVVLFGALLLVMVIVLMLAFRRPA